MSILKQHRKALYSLIKSSDLKTKEAIYEYLKTGEYKKLVYRQGTKFRDKIKALRGDIKHIRAQYREPIDPLKDNSIKKIKENLNLEKGRVIKIYIGVDSVSIRDYNETTYVPVRKEYGHYSKRCNYPKNIRTLIVGKEDIGKLSEMEWDQDIQTLKLKTLSSKRVGDYTVEHNRGIEDKKNKGYPLRDYYKAISGKESYHADSVAKAINGLKRKLKAKAAKNITPESLITMKIYRNITGACEMGMKAFCDKNNLDYKVKIKAKDLLPLLINYNAYGLEKFRRSIKNEA